MKRRWRSLTTLVLASTLAALVTTHLAAARSDRPSARAVTGCQLANGIRHVIYLQFDNTHLFRDRAQFASDLEQMPHLLNFIRGSGTLLDNDHTVLISHTSNGILSSLTGLYPDRHGVTVGNSYRYFRADGTSASTSAFKYWTDLVDPDNTPPTDPLPNMVNGDSGTPKITPAPWVPYTRAGCDWGATSLANVVLENTNTGPNGDITKVFGSGSPEWNEARANPTLAQADFVGIAIHCASGGGICNGKPNAKPDLLPDEPNGYAGYLGLFGAKYVNPAITGGQPVVNDIFGNPIRDPRGNPGFPGFDLVPASTTLGYVANMQEAGVPVTFGYISDAHDNHHDPSGANVAFGPGEPGYIQQLHDYDAAFNAFFQRMGRDGLNKSNTLFVVTVDENDHFAGGNSRDGSWSHTFCNLTAGQTCPPNQIGEVNLNLNSVLPVDPNRPVYSVHADSAPTVYVNGQPVRTDTRVRKFERDVAVARAIDPYVSSAPTPITLFLADPVEEQTLHMVNADPRRTPTFTLFANPDYFITTSDFNCPDASHRASDCIDYHFAWSHGDATEDIGRTWVGMVGAGIRNLNQTSDVWADHTDVQPTMLALTGLQNDYVPDGRVLAETLGSQAMPAGIKANFQTYENVAQAYKQLTAPFGQFAHSTLRASTKALASGDANDDSTYANIESQIASLTSSRDSLASQMRAALTAAAFGGTPISNASAGPWLNQAAALINAAAALPH